MTNKEKKISGLFREALYKSLSVPELLEHFSKSISEKFSFEDFLILQMASQLHESAQIRKLDADYMKMMSLVSTACYNLISERHPDIVFCTSQRFKSALSEIHKRYERVQDGLSPEIKDLLALRVILLEPETQDTLKTEYQIAKEIMEHFSITNSDLSFPVLVNLSVPDKSISQSSFDSKKHPEVLIPDETTLIKGLEKLGKDYIHFPKKDGYQSFHISLELVKKDDTSFRIFSEIQIRSIAQHQYSEFGPANHKDYKDRRNKKMEEIFNFEKEKVSIRGYYPNKNSNFELDFSGFSAPLFVSEHTKKIQT